MKKWFVAILTTLIASLWLTSCRPPELEGAFVDYKAGRIDQALENALKATQLYPNNAEAWYLLGELYGKKDNIAGMVHAFDQSLKISDAYADKIKNQKLYYFAQSFNNGVKKYNAYTKSENREAPEAIDNLKQAIQYFKYAKLINNDYKATNLIGLSYLLLGKKDSALVYYMELTKIKPDTVDAWLSVGNYYFNNQDWDNAITYLTKALELDPQNVESITLLSQCYDQKAQQYAQKKEAEKANEYYKLAIDTYLKAIKLNPKEKAFYYNLGLIYYKQANKEGVDEKTRKDLLEKTIYQFGKVLEMDPSLEVAYEIKSISEINLEKYEDALKTLKAALERFPENGSFWYNLGVVYSHLNNEKEAKAAFAKAKKLGIQ